jgi:hypothetical protein
MENRRNVPTGTFHFAENLRRKSLILGAGFWGDLWNHWVRLWKKRLLSRTSNAYESRLDRRLTYFLWYVAEGAPGLIFQHVRKFGTQLIDRAIDPFYILGMGARPALLADFLI